MSSGALQAVPRSGEGRLGWLHRCCYAPPVLRAGDARIMQERAEGEDEQLVRAAAAGDRDALGALYDRFAPSMLAVAQRILGGRREAEDVVQDVFLEAWHRARYYDRERGTVRTWLMLRLRSRALDRLRSAKRTAGVSLDDAGALQQPSAQDDVAAGPDGQVLHRALAELPDEQRAVLELGYFSGYTCAEIAARLELPVGTVKSRMSRAVAQLRTQLSPGEEERS
jgi:RNA polymerase sigma-70 factor (ECF subfamily)